MTDAPVPISDSYIGPGSGSTGTNPSVWPRRASRACASCRRDKVRCDGARPCNACVKKGYTGDQCTDGCEQCRRARVRCEEGKGKPCKRCREMNVHCVDSPQLAPQQELVMQAKKVEESETSAQGSGSSPGKSQRGTDRAKLACVGCRRDNKKCDDNRPCSRCIARSEDCVHVTRGPKLVKLRCERCREENKRCEDSRPCKYCLDTKEECVDVPRRGRGTGSRVKFACMSCRRDKIRCNGDRPCASCVKRRCECIERTCAARNREGKGSECIKRSEERASSEPASNTPNTLSSTTIKEEDYHFASSQDNSRWSFATSAGVQTPPILPQFAMYSGQQHGMVSVPVNGHYYFPDSEMSNQAAQLGPPTLMQNVHNNPYPYHSSSHPATTYFFDSLDSASGKPYISYFT